MAFIPTFWFCVSIVIAGGPCLGLDVWGDDG